MGCCKSKKSIENHELDQRTAPAAAQGRKWSIITSLFKSARSIQEQRSQRKASRNKQRTCSAILSSERRGYQHGTPPLSTPSLGCILPIQDSTSRRLVSQSRGQQQSTRRIGQNNAVEEPALPNDPYSRLAARNLSAGEVPHLEVQAGNQKDEEAGANKIYYDYNATKTKYICKPKHSQANYAFSSPLRVGTSKQTTRDRKSVV